MSRKLTEEERELWHRLSRSVTPLTKRLPKAPAKAGEPPSTGVISGAQKKAAPPRQVKAAPPPAKPRPALAPLEDRTRRRLARGLVEIDARIDLHGMRQERAFARLHTFLQHAQARGHSLVLVVTGKGSSGGEGRGVLRQSVPAWLSRPDLRPLVVGFEPAARRHGGEGALYVRIRRRREARRAEPPDS